MLKVISRTSLILFLLVIVSISAYSAPEIAGCPIFPANNIWNTPIDNLPVHPLSDSYVSIIGASKGLKADFGSGLWEGAPIGIPYITVPGTQPKVPVTFEYDDESDPGPYPIPANAPIEGGPSSDGDRHVLVIDQDNCILYETYSSYPQGDGSWQAGSGAVFDLTSNELHPDTWTSADAAGLPILPGLVRYDEILAGEITHAIRFTVPQTQKAYVWPARHQASDITDTAYPPMGMYFRLKADVDISGYSPDVQIILRALKKYGMILADNGSSWYMSGVPDERWDNDELQELRGILGANFEAVDVSSLIIDPNSGQVNTTAATGGYSNQSISGSLTSAPVRPTFQFRHQTVDTQTEAPGEWYNVYVRDNNLTPVLNTWFEAEDYCAGLTCTYKPDSYVLPAGFTNGNYTWRVRAWENNAFKSYSSSEPFSVNVPAIVVPEADNGIVDISSGRPVLRLPNDPGTAWYHFWIGTSDYQTTTDYNWYEKDPSQCTESICTIIPNAHPTNGSYELWAQTWGPAGWNNNDSNFWQKLADFEVNFEAPIAITPTTTTASATNVTFTWEAGAGTTWFQVWAGTSPNYDQTLHWNWHSAIDLGCPGGGTCTLTVSNVTLSSNKTYTYFVQGWGPGGFTENDFTKWVEGAHFSP